MNCYYKYIGSDKKIQPRAAAVPEIKLIPMSSTKV